jgi:hypothetical protein
LCVSVLMSILTIGFPASLARGILHDQGLSELPISAVA